MNYRKKSLVLIAVVLLLFALSSCVVDKSQPDETGVSDGGALPGGTVEDENMPDEKALGDVAGSKEYEGWVGAYLDILMTNSAEIEDANGFEIFGSCPVAMLDVFSDETPELLYLYQYDDPGFFPDDDFPVPCLFIKIFSYSEKGGIDSVSNICIYYAAGGPNNYCVFLTREGELMLYRSNLSGGSVGWGVWQIEPGQNLENTEDYWVGIYSSDLAKLYYVHFPDENCEEKIVYKSNGEEISKEQYDKTAKEMKDDIEYMIFPGLGDGEMYDEEFWKGVTPFEAKSMTYDEAVAWLKAQGDCQEQK